MAQFQKANEAGQLAIDIGKRGRGPETGQPLLHAAIFYIGLGQMIDDHRQLRQVPRQRRHVA